MDVLRKDANPGNGFIEVVPVSVAKPWNGYDDLSDPERIAELALAIGADLALVEQYERENDNRSDVIEALQGAVTETDETIIVSA